MYPHPTTMRQVLARSRCNMCSKQCLPGTCHHKQDIHRHRHTCNYVRPAYQPKNDCPKPSKHTLQISTTRSHCRHQATDPQLRSISCIKRMQPSESKEGDSSLRLSKARCQHRRPLRTQANGAEAVTLSAHQELCLGDKLKRSSASMHTKG